tara:strand:+ start:2989 stop:3198 length:210 start_codon:yes stop_codon:yes gene_type:complete
MPTTTVNKQEELATRFQQSYNKREVGRIVPKEYALMDKLGVTRSQVHKIGVEELYDKLFSTTSRNIYSL